MPEITITLSLKHDPEYGPIEDMDQVIVELHRLASLPITSVQFGFPAESREDADLIERRLADILEERPYSIGAELKRVDKSSLRRIVRSSEPAPLTPIERAINRIEREEAS